MNDTIEFLKKIKNDTKSPREVTEILAKLDYTSDLSKKAFLDKLHLKSLISYNIAGSVPDIYKREDRFNEVIGFKEEAKPLRFYATITDEGQTYLNKHLSERRETHVSVSTVVNTVITVLLFFVTIYQLYTNHEKDKTIDSQNLRLTILQTRIDSLLSLRSQGTAIQHPPRRQILMPKGSK